MTHQRASVNDNNLGRVQHQLAHCLREHSTESLSAHRAAFRSKHLSPLLDTPTFETLRPGSPSRRIRNLQETVLGHIKGDYPFEGADASLRSDQSFLLFAKRICTLAARHTALGTEDIQRDREHSKDFIDHIVSHYQLLRETNIAPSIINKTLHGFSVFQVGKILAEAETIFGSSPHTKSLVKTASSLVFMKKYPSIKDAKLAYEQTLQDARSTFGADKSTATLVKTAANLIFHKTYASMSEAKKRYQHLLRESHKTFGKDKDTQSLTKTAACLVFIKKYPSIAHAKAAYDKVLQEAHDMFALDSSPNPPIKLAACLVFNKTYSSLKEAKKVIERKK